MCVSPIEKKVKTPFKIKEFYYIHNGRQYKVTNDFNLPAYSSHHHMFMAYLKFIVALQGRENA